MAEFPVPEEEIDDVIARTYEESNKFPGMTYADGVRAAIQWLQGDSDANPMED